MVITDPKQIMSIIIEEFEKQIIANCKTKGFTEEETMIELKTRNKKLPRIAAVITKRIVNG